MDNLELKTLISTVVTETITALKNEGFFGKVNNPKTPTNEKSAYSKTEALLYNYMGFKKIISERELEIEEIRKYGVPQKCGGVTEFVQKGGLPHGIVLPEESVEAAVQRIERSVQGTVDAIALIDKCMAALKNDPYYRVLEMRYFEGRTQEDIATFYGVSQVTISNNKNRLVRELSMRLFPNQVIQEFMS